MIQTSNPEAAVARLESLHDLIERLRGQVKLIKKQDLAVFIHAEREPNPAKQSERRRLDPK
jgi:hypothetical protein